MSYVLLITLSLNLASVKYIEAPSTYLFPMNLQIPGDLKYKMILYLPSEVLPRLFCTTYEL